MELCCSFIFLISWYCSYNLGALHFDVQFFYLESHNWSWLLYLRVETWLVALLSMSKMQIFFCSEFLAAWIPISYVMSYHLFWFFFNTLFGTELDRVGKGREWNGGKEWWIFLLHLSIVGYIFLTKHEGIHLSNSLLSLIAIWKGEFTLPFPFPCSFLVSFNPMVA